MPIPDDPRLELLSGAFVRNGFSFSYRSGSWTTDHGFIVDGEGAIQPGRQKGDAAYGPKKPPPLPPIPVTIKSEVHEIGHNRWRWDSPKIFLPDGRPLWNGDKPADERLTTACAKEWQRTMRDAWEQAAAERKLSERLRLRTLLWQQVSLKAAVDAWTGMAVGQHYALTELETMLAGVGDTLEFPKLGDTPWGFALYSPMDYLRKYGAQITEYAKQFELVRKPPNSGVSA